MKLPPMKTRLLEHIDQEAVPLIKEYARECIALASLPQEPASQEARHAFAFGPLGCQCKKCGAIWAESNGVNTNGPCRASAAPSPASQEVAAGWKLLKDSTHDERSWPEDFDHENGRYACSCVHCLRMFVGHKRRVTCRTCATCATQPPAASVKQSLTVEQAAPLTDEQWSKALRAAQLRSELGAYACANLAGGYDLITELYTVMAEALKAPEGGQQ